MLLIHLVDDFEVASKAHTYPCDLRRPFWMPRAVSALQSQLRVTRLDFPPPCGLQADTEQVWLLLRH